MSDELLKTLIPDHNQCALNRFLNGNYNGNLLNSLQKLEKYSTNKKEEQTVEEPLDIDSSFGDGKLPACFNCKKTVYDPNQLTNLDGQFYCKTCRDSIISQRKGEAQ